MASNNSLELVLVKPNGDDELWEQCRDIRLEVFAKEQGFPQDTEIDEYDKTAMHFLLRTLPSHHPIGVIRFNPPAPPAPSASDHSHPSESSGTKLGRLAVLKAHRGKGHGDRLVNAVHDWVKENPQSAGAQVTSGEKIDTNNETDQQQDAMIWLHAQLPVKKFYSRFGYVSVGDEFDEEGAPHQRMELRIDTQILRAP